MPREQHVLENANCRSPGTFPGLEIIHKGGLCSVLKKQKCQGERRETFFERKVKSVYALHTPQSLINV